MAKTIREQFGAEIRNARTKVGITQMELAQKTGNPQGYISDVEQGKRNMTLDTMVALARAVNLEILLITREPAKKL